MSSLPPAQQEYINTEWVRRWDGVIQSQNHILNWLFTMNTGGVAGSLAFASKSAPNAPSVAAPLVLFSLGLLCLVVYAACMFYLEAHYFQQFKVNVKALHEASDKAAAWYQFVLKEGQRPDKYRICEVLAWIGGLAGAAGVLTLACAILK